MVIEKSFHTDQAQDLQEGREQDSQGFDETCDSYHLIYPPQVAGE
jgi:hypothetical protein